MPQPLSSIKRAISIHLGNSWDSPALTRPALALSAMHVLAQWSLLESFTNLLFTRMLSGNSEQAAAIFATIRNSAGQRDAMNAVASVFLAEDKLRQDLLTAVLEVIQKAASTRNRIAHWVWGHSPDLPDAVLLADPVAYTFAAARARSWTPNSEQEYPDIDPRRVFVYLQDDFDNAASRIERASSLVATLRLVIDPDQIMPDLAAQSLSRLSAEPEIRKELDRLNKNRESDQE